MNDYYPPGTFELPGEREKLKTYVFEVGGEVEVEANSEEEAEELMYSEMPYLITQAFRNGTIEIE